MLESVKLVCGRQKDLTFLEGKYAPLSYLAEEKMLLFRKFLRIDREINSIKIIPALLGSVGLEYVSHVDWGPSDIDIHVPGDHRGWDTPDENRIYDWDKIVPVMTDLDYTLIDIHEHQFKKSSINVEFGSIDSLSDFAGIRGEELIITEVEGGKFSASFSLRRNE